jgi:hypothetical protein
MISFFASTRMTPSPPCGGGSQKSSSKRLYALTALFLAEFVALMLFQAPYRTFDRFALWDSGGDLVIQGLMRQGWRPTVEFGYPYGLLGLFVGRIYYRFAPLTPAAFQIEVAACSLLSAWGLARFAAARRLGPLGVALLVLAVPDLLLVNYITLTHVMEQALLIHALAEQGRGRRATALALATACWFVKPSLAALVGLSLVIALIVVNRREGWRAWVRAFGPAIATAIVLGALLAATFGLVPLWRTLIPTTGGEVYRLNGFGFFFGKGRSFWQLPNAGIIDYFRYETAFYLLGTVVLAWGGLSGLGRLATGAASDEEARDDEVVATCALVQVGFVFFFFGHRNTWFYPLPMLTAGLATLAQRGRWARVAVGLLTLMLLVSDRSKTMEVVHRWRTESAPAATLGLWIKPADLEEWTKVRELVNANDGHAVLFAMCEGGALWLPGFQPPSSGYIVPGLPTSVEIERKVAQLRQAHLIVMHDPAEWNVFRRWPELKAAFDGCSLIFEGPVLKVYRRDRPPGSTSLLPGKPPEQRHYRQRMLEFSFVDHAPHVSRRHEFDGHFLRRVKLRRGDAARVANDDDEDARRHDRRIGIGRSDQLRRVASVTGLFEQLARGGHAGIFAGVEQPPRRFQAVASRTRAELADEDHLFINRQCERVHGVGQMHDVITMCFARRARPIPLFSEPKQPVFLDRRVAFRPRLALPGWGRGDVVEIGLGEIHRRGVPRRNHMNPDYNDSRRKQNLMNQPGDAVLIVVAGDVVGGGEDGGGGVTHRDTQPRAGDHGQVVHVVAHRDDL